MHRARAIGVGFAALFVAGSVGVAKESKRPMPSPQHPPQGTSGSTQDGLRYGLPFSQGKGFATLDEYIAHLKELGTSDVPYFLEVESDVFVPVAGRRLSAERFTREELRHKFGFDR